MKNEKLNTPEKPRKPTPFLGCRGASLILPPVTHASLLFLSSNRRNIFFVATHMAAAPNAVPTARFGLLDFDAVDTSGRPQLDNEEQLAGDYPDIRLIVGDDGEVGQGHLYISSK